MSVFLLYHPRTRPSGQVMAEALGVEAGIGLRGRTPSVLIRWGSQRPIDGPLVILNCSSALARASDKLRAFHQFVQHEVRCPVFTEHAHHARMWNLEGPVIGRTRQGYGGDGIVIYDSPAAVAEGHELYVQVVPARQELRLHVVGDEVVRWQYKVATTDETHLIRNHKNGYVFRGAADKRLNSDRYDAAIAAVQALGLDFGAVDLLIGEDDQPYVLEVNTAPACSPLTARVYAEAIHRYIGGIE